jgi:hypothetical protein
MVEAQKERPSDETSDRVVVGKKTAPADPLMWGQGKELKLWAQGGNWNGTSSCVCNGSAESLVSINRLQGTLIMSVYDQVLGSSGIELMPFLFRPRVLVMGRTVLPATKSRIEIAVADRNQVAVGQWRDDYAKHKVYGH